MEKKELFGIDYSHKEWVKILLYLFVGGTAALLEWGLFFLFYTLMMTGQIFSVATVTVLTATTLAFALSTLYHYFLGNILVFNSGSRYKRGKELSLVFAVSVTGLAFNLILMFVFTDGFNWPPMGSKVLASGVVVVWNYLSRKKWIFK